MARITKAQKAQRENMLDNALASDMLSEPRDKTEMITAAPSDPTVQLIEHVQDAVTFDLTTFDTPEITIPPMTEATSETETLILDAKEIEIIGDMLEAEAVSTTPAETIEPDADDLPAEFFDEEFEENPDFDDLLERANETDVDSMLFRIADALDERAEYEKAKKGDGHNIQRTLDKARKAFTVTKQAARVFVAANVNPTFINRTLHDGSRYNVYAIDKVADLVRATSLSEETVSNAINRAIVKSLFRCAKAGVAFTGEIAKGCASDKYPVDLTIRKHLVRHTVSAGTASTQASSTMNALVTLGIVSAAGTARNPVYTLTDAPITKKLQEWAEAA